jgi:hypothetical protein
LVSKHLPPPSPNVAQPPLWMKNCSFVREFSTLSLGSALSPPDCPYIYNPRKAVPPRQASMWNMISLGWSNKRGVDELRVRHLWEI